MAASLATACMLVGTPVNPSAAAAPLAAPRDMTETFSGPGPAVEDGGYPDRGADVPPEAVAGERGAPVSWPIAARPLPGVDVRAAALLLSDQVGGNLAVEAGIVAAPGRADPPLLDVLLEVGGADLLAELDGDRLGVELFLYVLDPGRDLVAFHGLAVALDLKEWRGPILRSGLKLSVPLRLTPQAHTLRLLLRRTDGLAFSLQSLQLVEESAEEDPVPWRLLFPDPEGAWVQVTDIAAGPGVLPAAPGGRAWRPALRPVLAAQAPGSLFLWGDGTLADAPTEVSLLAADGGLVEQVELVFHRAEPARGGRGLWTAELPPLDMDPGPHTLRIRHPEIGELDREILAVPEVSAPAAVWASLDQAALQPPGEAPPGFEAPPFEALTARRRYGEVLRHLGEGRLDTAVQALHALEISAIGSGTGDVIERLASQQFRVVRGLVRREPDALVPILLLHHQAFFSALTRNAPMRAAHARLLVSRLAGLARSGELARPAAADLLASLAREQQAGAATFSAESLYEEALSLDRDHPLALMGLAMGKERLGDYRTAVLLFERRVQAAPHSPEARLRLGINLVRTGNRRRAARELDACLSAGPAWVRVVAAQERARLLMEAEDPRSAASLVEQTLDAFPGEESLLILRAYLADRTGDRERARELLAQVRPNFEDPHGSPRWRYAQWPEEDWWAARQRLERLAGEAMPALARALGDAE